MTREKVTPGRLWIFVFAVWGVILTGVLAGFFGPPGIIQAMRLRSLLAQKIEKTAMIEAGIARLDSEIKRLEKSTAAQEREVRRVLGYVASDEIVFDFAEAVPSGGKETPK